MQNADLFENFLAHVKQDKDLVNQVNILLSNMIEKKFLSEN